MGIGATGWLEAYCCGKWHPVAKASFDKDYGLFFAMCSDGVPPAKRKGLRTTETIGPAKGLPDDMCSSLRREYLRDIECSPATFGETWLSVQEVFRVSSVVNGLEAVCLAMRSVVSMHGRARLIVWFDW